MLPGLIPSTTTPAPTSPVSWLLAPDCSATAVRELLEEIANPWKNPARLYGLMQYLLYQKGFEFKNILKDKEDLGRLVMEQYNIELPEVCRDVAGSLSISYNLDEIYREEEKRLEDIRERLHKQINIFNEKPVVFFDLESPYFDFEPEDVHSLDTLGTLYSHIRVSDNWGKLTVNRHGCLISDNYKQLRITAKGLKIDRNHVYGEGWHMILNETWVIEEMDQNYFVRRIAP